MEIFNLRSNDVYDFDQYMDLSKPSFGGPKQAIEWDSKKKRKTLEKWTNTVKRYHSSENGTEHPNYDPTWKAFTSDLVHKQAGKKPSEIRHAIPTTGTIELKENKANSMSIKQTLLNEGRIALFEEFQQLSKEGGDNPFPGSINVLEPEKLPKLDSEKGKAPEVDEEKLNQVLENFSDTLDTLVGDIVNSMEIEKEEAADLVIAAVTKMFKPEEEEEEGEEGKEKKEGEPGAEKPKKKRRRPRPKKAPGAGPTTPPTGAAPGAEPKELKPEEGKEKKGGFPFGKPAK